jgi:hypothetical protein
MAVHVPGLSRSYRRLIVISRLVIILIGIVAFTASNIVPTLQFGHVNWNDLFGHLGAFIVILVSLDWFFNEKVRRELISEVVESAFGRSLFTETGIYGFLSDSKKIDYSSYFTSTEPITFGLHYDQRFIADNFTALEQRIAKGLNTTVLLLDLSSEAFKYLASNGESVSSAKTNQEHDLRNLRRLKSQDKRGCLIVLQHKAVLRYSFVAQSSAVWIRFYKNSAGIGEVPAFEFRSDGKAFSFFKSDLEALILQSGELPL